MPSDDDDDLLLVHQLPMDMDMDDGGEGHRMAHLLPPLARAPAPPPFRPPPPPAAAAAAAAAAESRIAFRGWLGAPRHWELWVAKLRAIHERLWRKLGILDAILASTYRFKRDSPALLHLASFWSPDTNTFAFPWGEATLTLQDIAVLGGFPADGSPAPAPLPPHWRPDEAALNGVRLGFNRSACKKAHHAAWIKHFLTDTATDADMEHAAFLALWLTRFVLPGHPESTMRQSLFPLAVRLARGDRVALAPAVLASLYRDLREIKAYLVAATTGGNAELLSPLSVHAPLYILQLWMWERFPVLCAGKANPVMDGEPRAARWHDVSKKMSPMVIREALSSGKNFVWQPYTSTVQHSGWVRASDIAANGELRSLAHCLRPCELVGMDCIEQYLLHRVARQFGLDQDVPGDVHRANKDWRVAWETYDLEGKNVAFFIPQSEPGVTARYAQWWRQPLPHSDLDVGAAGIAMESKCSKRKVKKTPAAMEAEAEKERKMKKARISPIDKKRKLEELYDAKLSDWLAAARTGSSGTGGGSCKRGSSPKSDTGSGKALLAHVELSKDDVVLLVPRNQLTTPAVSLEKDKEMNPSIGDKGKLKARSLVGTKDKCLNLKGYTTGDVDPLINQPCLKEKKEVASTEISTFTEDAKGEWSDMILKDTDELVRGADVSNRPEEVKPPVPMEKEECSDCLSDVHCSKDAREEVVTVDKSPGISNGPERCVTVMLEENNLDLREGKSFDVIDRPKEETAVIQESEKEANVAFDLSCEVSNRPEEVTAPAMEEKEEKGDVEVADAGNSVSGVGRAAVLTGGSIEVVLGSNQEVDAAAMNNGHDAVTLPEEIRPVQQANHVGDCLGTSCTIEDSNVSVLRENDGETTCDFVAEDQREVSCVEEIEGGESNQMDEKDSKQKPQKAPQVDTVEYGEDNALMEKDNEGEHEKVPQTVAEVATDNNMVAVLLGVLEAENEDMEKDLNLAKKDTEDMPKEVVEVEGAEHEQINTLAKGGAKADGKEVAEVEHIDVAEPKMHPQFDTEKPDKATEVGNAEMDEGKRLTGRDIDGKPGDVPKVGHLEVEKSRELIENDTGEKLPEVSDVAHAEMEEVKGLMKEDTYKKFEEVSELENTGMDGTNRPMEEDTDTKLKEVPDVNAEVELASGLERDNDWPEGILKVHLPARDEARWLANENTKDNTTKVPQEKHEKIGYEAPIEKDTKEKHNADGEDLPGKLVDESKEVYQVEQAEGEECKVLREKDTKENTKDGLGVKQAEEGQHKALTAKYMNDYIDEITPAEQLDGRCKRLIKIGVEEHLEEITQAQGKEVDKDMLESSKHSINGEMLCSSASIQSKGEQKEVSDEGMMEKQGIQDIELINEGEPPSAGAIMKVEGVGDHKALNMHEEVAMEQTLDCGIICENKGTQILEDSNMIDVELKSDLVIMEVDETQATGGIQNQETLDFDKQQAMEQEQDLGITIDNKKMIMSEDANMLGCDEFQTDSPKAGVNEVESTTGIQEQVMEKRLECEITDGNRRSLEVTNALGGGGVDTIVVAVDVNESNSVNGIQNQEACSMEEAREDKQHHGVGNVIEARILEDTSTIDSGELKSGATTVGVYGAESKEGTRNQWALSMEMELAVQEKQDEEMAAENTKRILVNTDAPEYGGVKPDETMEMDHETLPTVQAVNIAGDIISSKNQQMGVPWEDHNRSDVECSESNETARKESKGTLPTELEQLVEVKQENLENKTEMSVGRENGEASEQDQTSTEDTTIAPSCMDHRGENSNEWAEESTKSYGKYASDPINTVCQTSKFGRSSIEELRRIHNGGSIYARDIKESQARIRSEPSNRIQINNAGYYSRHGVQEPVSVSKDIKVPVHDSARVCARDHTPEFVTGPPEDTSRWRQEQYAHQILEDVHNARIAEKTRMEMEIKILKAQIATMQRQVMNLDHVNEVVSRSKRH